MQLKMQEILNFPTFYEVVKSKKLSMRTAYRLTQLARAVNTELQFYHEKLQNIIQEYGEIDENGQLVSTEDGKGIKLRPKTEKQCLSAINELQEVEITLPDIKFHIEDFEAIELNSVEINSFLPFIEE